MDRFGYAKTVDTNIYERNKEAADAENKHVLSCMNTGKLCIFTNTGKMHQVKVLDLPYGKFRDKGLPIDNVSNYDSTQEKHRLYLRRGTDALRKAAFLRRSRG